jgi:DNA-binding SARP family transcriptional activator
MANVIHARTRQPDSRGLNRERLDIVLSQIASHRMTFVIAPAGSGKTTALAQFVSTTTMHVVWYNIDSLDGSTERFLAYLQAAIRHPNERTGGLPWRNADDALVELEQLDDQIVIVLDDFHLIRGQPAESLVAQLVNGLPSNVHIAIGSRLTASFDTSRLRLDGDLLEINADDLRFRTWEAENLFEQTYGMLLRPDDVAQLTRQVAGWAAGFQLFHLAARSKSPIEQRHLIRTASTRSTLARQYLTQNVLSSLPHPLRNFLLQTSVLGVVSGELVDDLLDTDGGERHLRRLVELELFVHRLDDTTYRYHEVLRSHLEAELADSCDHSELAARYSRAADLLEGAGHTGEALRCQIRAGNQAAVSRLAGQACTDATMVGGGWLDALNDVALHQGVGDPWISMALARGEIVAGRFERARAHYRRAEELFGYAEVGTTCRRERADLESFLEPLNPPAAGWLGDLHLGLHSDPLGAVARLDHFATPSASVASGSLLFMAGRLDDAAARFDEALLSDAAPDWVIAAGRLGRQLVRLLHGPADVAATMMVIDRLTGSLESAWLVRFARAVVAMAPGSVDPDEAVRVAEQCEADSDVWGAAFAHLCAGVAHISDPEISTRHFRAALSIADQQRSSVFAAAAHAGLAHVLPAAERATHADEAQRLARRMGLDRAPIDVLVELAANREPVVPKSDAPMTVSPGPVGDEKAVTVRCFGELTLGGNSVEIGHLRPRALEVLMRLAVEIGHPVHRDRLIADLWAGADPQSAVRNLQVAVSAIRKALAADESSVSIDRVNGGYMLTEPSNGVCDLREFRCLQSRLDHASNKTVDATDEAERALALCVGELLPAAGTADWAVAEREQIRLVAARLARNASAEALDRDDPSTAIRIAERGLEFDRFDDALWRTAIDAHLLQGDAGAAETTRRLYRSALDELGLHVAH